MDKKLIKKYQESEKLQKQIQALQEKLKGVDSEAEELEKTELHKIFRTAKISFEEYTQIIKGVSDKDKFTKKPQERKEDIHFNKQDEREDIDNE